MRRQRNEDKFSHDKEGSEIAYEAKISEIDNAIYLYVGQRWSFINQTGDLSPNHQLAAYQDAIDHDVEISTPIIAPGVFQN